MTTERFIIDDAGTLIDMSTRNTYDYVSDVCGLLNELSDENEDRFNEQMHLQKQLHNAQKELAPIKKICEKYRIPLKDLPEILEEYIAYDNDDDW